MKDITELKVIETRVFRSDVIPFRTLITATQLKTFTSPFLFKKVEILEDENKTLVATQMQTGEFRYDNKVFPIDILTIEKNRIFFMIQADSGIADKFYNEIAKSLANIDSDGQFKKNKPLIKTMATNCVATFDFDYNKIFSEKMNKFIQNEVTKVCSSVIGNVAKVQILPKLLTFDVNYTITNKSLVESNITIQPKGLIIEPRIGSSFKERRFFTSSPTDSETHLNLISELEKSFKTAK